MVRMTPDAVNALAVAKASHLAQICAPAIVRSAQRAAAQRAERVGFEPTKACTLPAFQASAISQTTRPLHRVFGRKGRDANPRRLSPSTFSRRADSAST